MSPGVTLTADVPDATANCGITMLESSVAGRRVLA
jgi:hypothetical protein